MAKNTKTQGIGIEPSAMLASAQAANGQLQSLAAMWGVDWRALARCLAKAVKPRDLLQCLRSDDVLGCLLEKVDFAAVLECALGTIAGGEPEFQAD